MSLAAIILAALAFWGYGGVEVRTSFAIPAHYPPEVVAAAAPDNIRGGCILWLREEAWDGWRDDMRIRVVAHELFHCLTRSAVHDDDPESIMTGGIGTAARPHHWLALIAARPPLSYRLHLPAVAH